MKLQDRVFLIISVADAGPDSRLAAWRFFKVSILADTLEIFLLGIIADAGPFSISGPKSRFGKSPSMDSIYSI